MSITETSKEIGVMWKALSDEEKKPYQVYTRFTEVHCLPCHNTLHHT